MDQVSFTGVQYTDVSPIAPDEGCTHLWAFGVLMTLKLTGQQTGGLLSSIEGEISPGSGPPLHYHTREDETWYLMDGEMTWIVGLKKKESVATEGTMIFLPRGTPHTFSNDSGNKAHMLIIYTPAGLENWFLEVGKLVEDPTNPGSRFPLPPEQAMDTGMRSYGMVFIPRPQRLA